jgi:hypothetical protein
MRAVCAEFEALLWRAHPGDKIMSVVHEFGYGVLRE